MKWISAHDALPADEQEVLICYDEQYQLAKFDHTKQAFVIKETTKVKPAEKKISWLPLVAPPVSSR